MATQRGYFDPDLVPEGQFDDTQQIAGWFDPDLLDVQSAATFDAEFIFTVQAAVEVEEPLTIESLAVPDASEDASVVGDDTEQISVAIDVPIEDVTAVDGVAEPVLIEPDEGVVDFVIDQAQPEPDQVDGVALASLEDDEPLSSIFSAANDNLEAANDDVVDGYADPTSIDDAAVADDGSVSFVIAQAEPDADLVDGYAEAAAIEDAPVADEGFVGAVIDQAGPDSEQIDGLAFASLEDDEPLSAVFSAANENPAAETEDAVEGYAEPTAIEDAPAAAGSTVPVINIKQTYIAPWRRRRA